MAEDRAPSTFQDNFVRLLGLHGLSQHFTAQLLGVSEATMSAWMNGKATPSLAKAIDIAELFQISTDRLMGAEFSQLLTSASLRIPSASSVSRGGSGAVGRSSRRCELGRLESGFEDWPPPFGNPEAEYFKWVWNEAEANSYGA